VERGAKLDPLTNEASRFNAPLAVAARYGQLEIVRLLVERGAYLEHQDKYGRTPLMYAVYGGHLETVRLLVDQGANLNHQGKDGTTPLHIAAWFGRLEIMRLLVDHGANIEHQNHGGRTPLDCALEQDWVGFDCAIGRHWAGHDLVYLLVQAAGHRGNVYLLKRTLQAGHSRNFHAVFEFVCL
jgi:hypothetical protein